MYTWEQMAQANSSCKSLDVKGKDYIEVHQRIKAFRMVCPGGAIITDMISNDNGVCVFRATVYDEEQRILGTGTAYEKESASYINKTSYIENCETSAVGRALGMCGFGIDTSVASAEEVQNAINNQENTQPPKPRAKKPDARNRLIAKLKELNINIDAYAQANGLSNNTDQATFERLLAELEAGA